MVVLSSLPGVGEKTAIRMLEKFGSPLKVLSAPTKDLAKISGLGESRAKKIKKMLDELNMDEIKKVKNDLNKDVMKVFNVKNSVNLKTSYGGTSIKNIKTVLSKLKKEFK